MLDQNQQNQQTPEEREMGLNAVMQSLMRQRNDAQNLMADREAALTLITQKLDKATKIVEEMTNLIKKIEEQNSEIVQEARKAIAPKS